MDLEGLHKEIKPLELQIFCAKDVSRGFFSETVQSAQHVARILRFEILTYLCSVVQSCGKFLVKKEFVALVRVTNCDILPTLKIK